MSEAELRKIADLLHPLERKVLPVLKQHSGAAALSTATGLQEVEVVRALQWLQNKKLAVLRTDLIETVALGSNGTQYAAHGLPEARFLKAASEKEQSVDAIAKAATLSQQEVGVCLGILRPKNAIAMRKDGSTLYLKLTAEGARLREEPSKESELLAQLAKGPMPAKTLSHAQKQIVEALRRRQGILETNVTRNKSGEITPLGEQLLRLGIGSGDVIDRLTPAIIRSGEWKTKKFRSYDTAANVPPVWGGRLQPYREFLDSVRRKFTSLGFTEMSGPIAESDFFDMDALYMPQFHSARDIHEAYYLKEPTHDKTLDPALVRRVKAAHEDGGDTGSRGWNYEFDVERTKRLLLRTQGTALSARMLASKDLRIPGKYFGITRCFRYDVIDATHLPDFNQTEGIIVEEGLTFRHLIGLLRMLAREFAGTDKIRVVPGYFPFTEPSAELFAHHPQLGWVELGGAGILRPEVVKPLLGKHISVLAWGMGIDRLGMFRLGIKDIRSLFSHDLAQLRAARVMR